VAKVPAGTHTVLHMRDVRYDQGVPDDLFGLANLSKGR